MTPLIASIGYISASKVRAFYSLQIESSSTLLDRHANICITHQSELGVSGFCRVMCLPSPEKKSAKKFRANPWLVPGHLGNTINNQYLSWENHPCQPANQLFCTIADSGQPLHLLKRMLHLEKTRVGLAANQQLTPEHCLVSRCRTARSIWVSGFTPNIGQFHPNTPSRQHLRDETIQVFPKKLGYPKSSGCFPKKARSFGWLNGGTSPLSAAQCRTSSGSLSSIQRHR